MIDFFHKCAGMTTRISCTAKVESPTRLTHLAAFSDEEDLSARVLLEIADTAEKRRKGLMGRTCIPAVTGMLFEGLTNGGFFWMKNCAVPIDVVFLNKAGVVTKTYAMTVDGGKERYQYDAEDVAAIELAGGRVKDWKIGAGYRVEIKRISKEAAHE